MRTYGPICGIGSRVGEANFRFARQPRTIVTWAELDFYDLPLIRPNGFVNSARQGFSNQELGRTAHGSQGVWQLIGAIPFLLSYRIDMLSRLKRRGFKTSLDIELIQTKELAMEYLDLDNDWFGRQADPGSID